VLFGKINIPWLKKSLDEDEHRSIEKGKGQFHKIQDKSDLFYAFPWRPYNTGLSFFDAAHMVNLKQDFFKKQQIFY
jgi:hypothetical protein